MSDPEQKILDEPEDRQPASPFAGRWVARVRGQVVAQGGTPEQARRAAQSSRYKETPEIEFMPGDLPFDFPPLVHKVIELLPAAQPIYLVGGAVRDVIIGRRSRDLDFVVPEHGIRTARKVANALGAAFLPMDEARDTGRVIVIHEDGTRTILDFATYRGKDLDADLQARDFTVNALALDPRNMTLIDPLGGLRDLQERRLKACTPASMSDDPVRVLRAIRLAADLGYLIQPETRKTMRKAVDLLANVSIERQRDELFKILDGPQASTAVRALDSIGVLPQLLPELKKLGGVQQPAPHVHDVWQHTLHVMRYLDMILAHLAPDHQPGSTGDLYNGLLVLKLGRYRHQLAEHFAALDTTDRTARSLLFMAALYHDSAKPLTAGEESGRIRFLGHDAAGAELAASRARALRLSNEEADRLQTIIANHMRPLFHINRFHLEGKEPSRRAIYRYFRDTGSAGVDLCLLALADIRATYDHTLRQDLWVAGLDICRLLLEAWWEKREESVLPVPLVNGHELMAMLGMSPGKKLGQLLEAIREGQAVGRIHDRDEAITYAREWMERNAENDSAESEFVE